MPGFEHSASLAPPRVPSADSPERRLGGLYQILTIRSKPDSADVIRVLPVAGGTPGRIA
jgi:hypothetical protein